jgi:gliding motility-associated-like protein/uncharacterized repeat protein (TIGR01451 family)
MSVLLKFSFIISIFTVHVGFSQIIQPFNIRYQVNQKGGLVFLANTSVGCGSCSGHTEMPPGGNSDNNDYNMTYVDIDTDPTTFMSNSDRLSLPNCSEIVWAGLYWVGMLNNQASSTNNYNVRNQVRLSVNDGAYLNLTADELLDNTVGKVMYNCFKDVTSIVQSNPTDATYRVANVVAQGGFNTFGGWTMVVVYRNIYESMKNITVFDGLANISASQGTVNINLSGFLTPPSGPVNFELGVVAHDGDRAQPGDQMLFNGAGNFVTVSDALHPANNLFNSTISRNGVLTPNRIPSYNNTLGHDANIFSPDNSALNYIGNSATTASIRVTTSSETILTSVITSAIDIYEPDLRAAVSFTDLNGGTVQPGDVLEYSITAKNIGSDASINTFLTDTLDPRLEFIPGSITYTFGPNSGAKTDLIDSDQAEFIASDNVIRARIGTGANGTTGGTVLNSPTGADSTVITFRVRLLEDCAVWQCGTDLLNKAFLFGTGQISGITNGNGGVSDVLDAQGCPSLESGLVLVDVNACEPFILNYTEEVCLGETIQFQFPNSPYITYSWSGPNGFSSNVHNPSIPDAAFVNAGDYELHVTYNGENCTDDTLVPVIVHALPTLTSLSLQNDICYQAGEGSISVEAVGNAPFTYSWTNGSTGATNSNLTAGTYTVIATDNNGCTVSETFNITEPPIFTVDTEITSNYNGQPISCFGASDGNISSTVTGGIAPLSYNWIGTSSTESSVFGLPAGQYIVEVTDQTGCVARDTVILTQPTELIASAQSSPVLCFGENTGSITLSVSGGTPNYTFDWSNGQTSQSISSLPAGSYEVTVTDVNGCTTIANAEITQPAEGMTLSATYTELLCFGDSNASIDLTVLGGVAPYSYAWNSGQTTEDLENLAAGTYTVIVTDANNCTSSYQHVVSQPTPLSVQSNQTNPLCQSDSQGSIELLVSGGTPDYTYAWNSGATSASISNLFAGEYVCEITDANGCSTSFSTTLTDPDALTLTFTQQDVLCYGATTGAIDITVSNGTQPYMYAWSTSSTDEDVSTLPAGAYYVNVSDQNNCGIFQAFTIIQPDTALYISSSLINQLACFGASNGSITVEVLGGTLPYTFTWSNGGDLEEINNLTAGDYTLLVTDANGCQLDTTFTITSPDELLVDEDVQSILCHGEATGYISLSSSGGISPYTYLWNTSSTESSLSDLPIGTYTATVTDANGCAVNVSIELTEPQESLNATSSNTNILCFGGTTGAIDLTPNGGTAPYTFVWSNGSTSEDLTNLAAESYSVTITDANGCSFLYETNITQPSQGLQVTETLSPVCFGETNGGISVQVTGGTAPYTYLWNTGATQSSIQSVGAGNYSLTVTDANGCELQSNFTLTNPSEIVVTETHVNVLCRGESSGSITASVTGGVSPYTYAWNNGSTNTSNTNLAAGTYSVTVTDANGCTAFLNVTLTEPENAIVVTSVLTNVLCYDETTGAIDVTVSGGTQPYTYVWSNGATSQDLSNIPAGVYSLLVTDANSCTFSYTAEVIQPASGLQLTGIGSSICIGASDGQVAVTVTGGTAPYAYQWDTNEADITESADSLGIGVYTVTVTDAHSCEATLSVEITQPIGLDGCVGLEMPNVFTPNNDNVNDVFKPIYDLNIQDYQLLILNRWGNVMFTSTAPSSGWDGTVNGNEASEGVYFWKVNFTDSYGKSDVMHGNVTLIRK